MLYSDWYDGSDHENRDVGQIIKFSKFVRMVLGSNENIRKS